jgi:hypothetical protein
MADTRPENPHVIFRGVAPPDPVKRGTATLDPRARLAHLDPAMGEHVMPHADRLERVLSELHGGFRDRWNESRANEELSARGRAKRVRVAGAEVDESLGRESKALAVAEALHAEKRARITAAPAIAAGDVVNALKDMEFRGYLRSLAAGDRSKLLSGADVVPEIIDAVLRAPAALSGVGTEVWSRLEQKARVAKHGREIQRLDAEAVALGALREAIDLVREDVKRAVEAAEREATALERPPA